MHIPKTQELTTNGKHFTITNKKTGRVVKVGPHDQLSQEQKQAWRDRIAMANTATQQRFRESMEFFDNLQMEEI